MNPIPPPLKRNTTRMPTKPNAPPVLRKDHVQEYRDLLIDLFERPQWGSMTEATRNKALDVLKAAASAALKSIELAHVEALTRNAMVMAQLNKESGVSDGAGATAPETGRMMKETSNIKAKTENLKARIAQAAVEEQFEALQEDARRREEDKHSYDYY